MLDKEPSEESTRVKRSVKHLKKVDDELVDELVDQMKSFDLVLVRKMRAGKSKSRLIQSLLSI